MLGLVRRSADLVWMHNVRFCAYVGSMRICVARWHSKTTQRRGKAEIERRLWTSQNLGPWCATIQRSYKQLVLPPKQNHLHNGG